MKCSKCGSEIADNSNFCDYCGAPVEKPAKLKCNYLKSRLPLWIAGGVVVLAGLVVGCIFLIRGVKASHYVDDYVKACENKDADAIWDLQEKRDSYHFTADQEKRMKEAFREYRKADRKKEAE